MSAAYSDLRVRLQAYLHGARKTGGLRAIAGRLAQLGAAFIVWTLLLPLTVILHLCGFRRLTVLASRIGHLAAEVDCFLKSQALGELPSRRWFLIAPPGKVANAHLMEYWRTRVSVINHPALCYIVGSMSRWLFMKYDVSHYVLQLNATQDIYRINAKWNGRPPILRLSPEDTQWAKTSLPSLGIPHDRWFACIHVREAGFSPADDAAHAHRNARPDAVIPAMQEIVRRGGWCVRMGDPTTTTLPAMEGVVDYAHHPARCARMDVVLCAKARFFLGNTSGLALVSSVFGVPSALVNMIPMSALAPLPADLSIPKLLELTRASRLLRFDEAMTARIGDFRYAALYAQAGLTVLENEPADITALVCEMLDRLDGRFSDTAEDRERQRRFMQLLQPGHYAYGAASRVGTAFLRKYAKLLS